MHSFRHIDAPLRLFAGDGSLKALGRELARLGCRRAVILCGNSLARDPALDLVRQGAGERLAGLCAGVRPQSPRRAVEEAAARLAEAGADAVIAVGGGSAMVSARAAVIALGERKPLDQLATRRDADGRMHSPRLEAPKIPILAVPTTPSTATVKPGTAIHDEESGERLALFDPATRPQAVFLAPALLMTPPAALVRGAAVNTLGAAVEGLASGSPDPLAQAMLIHAVRLTAAGLAGAANTSGGRADLAAAAILCGRGTDHTGLGLATVISHAVATLHGAEGGVVKAIALPHVLRFNAAHAAAGRADLALALGCAEAEVEAALSRLFRSLGLPGRLRELGVPTAALPDIAAKCMGDWFLRTNPRPVEREEEVLTLLQEAW